jgi:hypothetical protein
VNPFDDDDDAIAEQDDDSDIHVGKTRMCSDALTAETMDTSENGRDSPGQQNGVRLENSDEDEEEDDTLVELVEEFKIVQED